jgi:predicted dehydrogenase
MDLRLGLVGYGRWGRNIERTLLSFPNVSLTILARNDKPALGLDGVLIATPSATHAEIALPYIEAGVAVFIEKPMCTSVADAQRIVDTATRCGGLVFVGHLYLHHPGFLAALDQLPKLGAIRYVLGTGMNENPRPHGSVLWDWLPHDLSMASALFGHDPSDATSWSLEGGAKPRAAICKFTFGAASVVASSSWLSPIPRRATTIFGDNGTLIFDNTAERKLSFFQRSGHEPVYPSYSDELPLTCELRAFLAAIRSGTADLSSAALGARIVSAIAAAEESIGLGGKPVKIPAVFGTP